MVLHLHAREADGTPTQDRAAFARLVEGIRTAGCDAVLGLYRGMVRRQPGTVRYRSETYPSVTSGGPSRSQAGGSESQAIRLRLRLHMDADALALSSGLRVYAGGANVGYLRPVETGARNSRHWAALYSTT